MAAPSSPSRQRRRRWPSCESAGLSARTIAQFRIDLTSGTLPTGTVVILDEISQTSTRDGHTVLAAVDACPGAQLWILGDPRQAPAVKAGGIAAEIDTRATTGSIPAAQLTVNRRHVDPDDCRALNLLRGGDPVASQQLRREHGWEHTGENPEDTLREMADAVTADIVRHGAETSVALTVSHAQAEDLADRVRRRLTDAGQLTGPTITGPGWTTDRRYQAGDRVLLHTRHGDRHSPLVNGTVGTITAVDAQGLLFRPDQGMPVPLPAAFVQGVRADGAPNLSHAWARTVDGSQGGTWDHIHLLGTTALDAYRGYTAQSRSRQPTHTWNTAMLPTLDFGGRLAHGPDPDRDVAVALARIPDTTMAAIDDPWTLDRHLRHLIAAHHAVLDGQPPDRHRQLDEADRQLAAAQENLAAANNALAATQHALDRIGPFAALTRRGRAQRSDLEEDLLARQARSVDAAGSVATAEVRVACLTGEQAAHHRHEQEHGWRRGAIDDAWERLDQHWTDVAVVCVRADQPLAYGVEPLRIGRQHLTSQLVAIEAALPQDLSYDRDIARTQARAATRARAAAEQQVAAAEAALDEQTDRRWPRRDKIAIGRCTDQLHAARQQLLDARHTESTARARFGDLDQHEQDRSAALAATGWRSFRTHRPPLTSSTALSTAPEPNGSCSSWISRPSFTSTYSVRSRRAPPAEPSGATKPTASNIISITTPATTGPGIVSSMTSARPPPSPGSPIVTFVWTASLSTPATGARSPTTPPRSTPRPSSRHATSHNAISASASNCEISPRPISSRRAQGEGGLSHATVPVSGRPASTVAASAFTSRPTICLWCRGNAPGATSTRP